MLPSQQPTALAVSFAPHLTEGAPEPRHAFLADAPVGPVEIMADVRIDNREELAGALGRREQLPSASDADLILAAYERWGEACPQRLLGDFAFAIVDRRRHRIFCARDPFGVKPLYFHRSDTGFVCSSTIEGVLRVPYVSRALDPYGIADHLTSFSRDRTQTLYRAVKRLAPGHTLTVGAERARTSAYWTPDPVTELRLGSDAEYDEAFRGVFRDAVHDRLRPDGRIGSTLSGGIDSSSITAMAQVLRKDGPLPTFTGVFDTLPEIDDRRYARALAAHVGADAHECPADRFSPLADWEGAPWRGAEPFLNAHLGLTRAYQDAARREGIGVLLTGFGGDDVVAHGFAYLRELAASFRLRTLLSEARALSGRSGRPLHRLIRYAMNPLVPEPVRRRIRALRRQDPDWPTENPLRPDVVRTLALGQRVLDLTVGPEPRTQREAHARALTGGLAVHGLESFHRTAALFGIERRYPFYDRRLVEFCLSLPPDQRLRDGWTRLILRRALGGILPEEVRWRVGKSDMSPAFMTGMRTTDRPLLDDVVAHPGPIAEWVDRGYLVDLHRRCLADGDAASWFTLYRVAVMALWLRENQHEAAA